MSKESTVRAPLLLNLLNELRKIEKMLGKPRILSTFFNSFNKFNNTWALLYDPLFIT